MTPSKHYLDQLPDYLDEHGELAPPWARFPEYMRTSIGWRMGFGETWQDLWSAFLSTLDSDPEARASYLLRHPVAPHSWADAVHSALYVEHAQTHPVAVHPDLAELDRKGLVGTDVAYGNWLARNPRPIAPWEKFESPVKAARYGPREFTFWARWTTEGPKWRVWVPRRVPGPWRDCERARRARKPGTLEPADGLLTLAKCLCAGSVRTPWSFGLSPSDFAQSYGIDMPYVDAFRLWLMNAFDDEESLRTFLVEDPPPAEWEPWFEAEFETAPWRRNERMRRMLGE